MKKFICGLMAAVMLACAIPTSAFGAETYYMDLQSMTEKEFKDSTVDLQFYINGQDTYLHSDGRTRKPDVSIIDEKDLGSAILFRYDPAGDVLSQNTMNVTYVPIRRVANALGLGISWNDETKNVVLDTPKGRIEFPVGATSITAPDGTVYEETTYRFPNGDPINITSMRDGRVYVTARFISTFCMPDAKYSWKETECLTITGTVEGTTVQRAYGLNTNYANADDRLNWEAMPNLMAALEGQNWSNGSARLLVRMYIGILDVSLHFSYYSTQDGLEVKGWDPTMAHAAQMPIIEGLLKDMVCEADREAIVNLLNTIYEHVAPGYTKTAGATQEARDWWKSFTKTYELSETKIVFTDKMQFTITTK